jgi:hypothetical protein
MRYFWKSGERIDVMIEKSGEGFWTNTLLRIKELKREQEIN